MSDAIDPQPMTAVLVAVQLPGVTDEEHRSSLEELSRLVHTLGHRVMGTVSQKRPTVASAAVIGEGKLEELAKWTGGKGTVPSRAPEKKDKARLRRSGKPDSDEPEKDADADANRANLVVVDHEISPSQARNLEKATGATVLDRTGVIVEIFHRHAQSREARMQVEIARLLYVAPRMRESGGGDRQRGGIGGKGAGESALELDRRKIRDRIAELRNELALVEKERGTRRARRQAHQRVALVGYTNAGKSSWMRALTHSDVLIADKLFATLDTTVRALQPEVHPRILVSDTVGFIKQLPHDLVASFRSTLEEALEASLLVHVVDAADATFRAQLEVTRKVLTEIGATNVPSIVLLNKMDRVGPELRVSLESEFPDALRVSVLNAADVAMVRDALVRFFERDTVEGEVRVPYARKGVVGEIHERARVIEETYDEAGGVFRVRAHPETLAQLQSLAAGEPSA